MTLAKNLGILSLFVVIPAVAWFGSHQEPTPVMQHTAEETQPDPKWVREMFEPTVEKWRSETLRCEFNWQMDNLPVGETGVVKLPPVPAAIHDLCNKKAVFNNPLQKQP